MRYLSSFARFCFDFIVGDDWRVAIGVVIAISATIGLVDIDAPAWWLVPLAVAILINLTVRRAADA